MSEAGKPEGVPKITQGRSPAYPYIPLGRAIERVQQIVAAGVGRNAYPPETFYKLWDLGSQSSGARQTMAALNHFNLVDYDGRGAVRKVRLTDLALKICLDKVPGSADRAKALKEAALSPPIHAEMWARYQHMLPADVVLETYLTRDREYNVSGAQALINEYKDTLEFAGLDKPEVQADSGDTFVERFGPDAKVGDMVLIEINGTLMFAKPKRVVDVVDHSGEAWVYVEGEESAVKMSQVTVQAASPSDKLPQDPPPPRRVEMKPPADPDALPEGWFEEVLIDDGGEEIKIRYRGKATPERYAFIRDYLDFKLKRLGQKQN